MGWEAAPTLDAATGRPTHSGSRRQAPRADVGRGRAAGDRVLGPLGRTAGQPARQPHLRRYSDRHRVSEADAAAADTYLATRRRCGATWWRALGVTRPGRAGVRPGRGDRRPEPGVCGGIETLGGRHGTPRPGPRCRWGSRGRRGDDDLAPALCGEGGRAVLAARRFGPAAAGRRGDDAAGCGRAAGTAHRAAGSGMTLPAPDAPRGRPSTGLLIGCSALLLLAFALRFGLALACPASGRTRCSRTSSRPGASCTAKGSSPGNGGRACGPCCSQASWPG